MGDIAMNQWQANIYTSTFFDANGNGVRDGRRNRTHAGADQHPGFRDGSFSNFNNTDLAGNAGFNEIFPLFSWYVVETDWNRYKPTGTHVVYDAGGPGRRQPGVYGRGNRTVRQLGPLARTWRTRLSRLSVPVALRIPGRGCIARGADCAGKSINPTVTGGGSTNVSDPPSSCTTSATTGATTCSAVLSTGRIDPPWGGERRLAGLSPDRIRSSSSARRHSQPARTAAIPR